MKKVSVLTPCYNGCSYVGRFLDSLLLQTYSNFEVIVVDDGSTDGTKDIVLQYVSKFMDRGVVLTYIYQDNGGQASAINNGLKHVSGDYLIWPDSDDFYNPDSIELLANFLSNNSSYKAVRGFATFVDEVDLKVLSLEKPKDFNKEDLFLDYMLVSDNVKCFPGIMMIDFNEFKLRNNGLDIYVSRQGQNWQMILPMLYFNKCKNLDVSVYNYVVRKGSHSRSNLDFEKSISRFNGFRSIIVSTISKFIIDKKELNKYVKIIDKKIKKDIMIFTIKYFIKGVLWKK